MKVENTMTIAVPRLVLLLCIAPTIKGTTYNSFKALNTHNNI